MPANLVDQLQQHYSSSDGEPDLHHDKLIRYGNVEGRELSAG